MKVIGNLTESDIEKINEHVRKYGKGDVLKNGKQHTRNMQL